MSKRILVTFGTRPEAIKMAPVIRELRAHSAEFSTIVCSTGQHQSMMEEILRDFDIRPDIVIRDLRRNGHLGTLTSSLLSEMETVVREVGPDVSVVHGDTSTALSAALASFYEQVPVAHVEAGLRTNEIFSPFPEEFNRRTISLVSTLNFAPTTQSAANLRREGVGDDSIVVTGNTVVDALLWTVSEIRIRPELEFELESQLGAALRSANSRNKFVLVTAHRRENLDSGIRNICEAIRQLALDFPNVRFIFPVHLNPLVGTPVKDVLGKIENVHLLGPVSYRQFVLLLMKCHFVITDSGGIQEEAPGLGKPVLVLRDVTERPEAVQAGTVKLVGTKTESIITAARNLLEDDSAYVEMSRAQNPYGDGQAAVRIVDELRAEHN